MATTKWAIDPTHSEIGFKVKHMMFTNVSGKFGTYDATITTEDDNFENASFEFSADIDSINTNNTDRDNHLKSGDFFDAENHPKLTFKASSFTKDGDDYELTGDLTLRGITKSVKFPVEFEKVDFLFSTTSISTSSVGISFVFSDINFPSRRT